MNDETIVTGLSNYYGTVKFEVRNGEYVMTLMIGTICKPLWCQKSFMKLQKKGIFKMKLNPIRCSALH